MPDGYDDAPVDEGSWQPWDYWGTDNPPVEGDGDDGGGTGFSGPAPETVGGWTSILNNFGLSGSNAASLAGGLGLAGLLGNAFGGGSTDTGYKGGIPNLVANREMLPIPTTTTNASGQTTPRRPGSGGVTYFSPMRYSQYTPAPAPATGMSDAQLDSIGAFLQTNPTPEALSAAMQQFGVSQADVDRARARLGTTRPPQSAQDSRSAQMSTRAGSSPFVVGGASVGSSTPAPTPAPSPAPTPANARLQSIAAFLKTNPTPQALTAAMQQHGVSQNDVDLARLYYGNSPGADSGGILGYYADMLRNSQPAPTPAPAPTGMTNEQLDSIGAFLNTNPTPEALASAMQQFGVSQADVDRARARLGTATQGYAQGGIATLGYAKGRLLDGPGDGVSDSIPATIDGTHPAALADGEYVIPARIVSELGNGSTKAGAQKLDAMMKRIQTARRKATDIAANTRVDKYLPA